MLGALVGLAGLSVQIPSADSFDTLELSLELLLFAIAPS